MSTKPTSIEESPEEAASKFVDNIPDDVNKYPSYYNVFIAGANHQKEVDKAKVEDLINSMFYSRKDHGNTLFTKKIEYNNALTDLIKQIKAL